MTPAPAWAGAGAALVFLAVGSTLVWVATSERAGIASVARERFVFERTKGEARFYQHFARHTNLFFGAERSDEGNTHR